VEEIFCSILGGKSKPPSSWNFMSFSRALFNLPKVSAAHDKRRTDVFKNSLEVRIRHRRRRPPLSDLEPFQNILRSGHGTSRMIIDLPRSSTRRIRTCRFQEIGQIVAGVPFRQVKQARLRHHLVVDALHIRRLIRAGVVKTVRPRIPFAE
jgi:hypothetical protein